MGKIDIMDRQFFSDITRFAELINIEFYHGEEVLIPEELELLTRNYPSLISVSGEKSRDILMRDRRQNICYGLEIETESDYSMPERVMIYDACEYEYQIRENDKLHRDKRDYKNYREKKSRMKKREFLMPAITIVLYLGEGHWEGRHKLSHMFGMSEERKVISSIKIQDYNFPLLEADFIHPEKYHTDLQEFFRAMQCRRDKEHLRELFQTERFMHLNPETQQIIAVHLNIRKLIHKMEKEDIYMCKAFDDLMREEKQEGRKEEKILIVKRMLQEGLDETLIRRITKCTRKELAAATGSITLS